MKEFRTFACVLIVFAFALPAFAGSNSVTLPGGETLELWAPGAHGVGAPKPAQRVPGVAWGLTGLAEPLELRVAVVVKADGTVAAIEPFDAAPTAAIQAARVTLGEWEWKPARRKGKPVDAYTVWTLRFEPDPVEEPLSGPVADDWHERHLALLTARDAVGWGVNLAASNGASSPSPASHGGPVDVAHPRFPQITSAWNQYIHASNVVSVQPNTQKRK